MPDSFISRAFSGRRRAPESAERVPPGQYVTHDFPVLSAGPTPRSPLADWTFRVEGLVGEPVSWTWDEFLRLPARPSAPTVAARARSARCWPSCKAPASFCAGRPARMSSCGWYALPARSTWMRAVRRTCVCDAAEGWSGRLKPLQWAATSICIDVAGHAHVPGGVELR